MDEERREDTQPGWKIILNPLFLKNEAQSAADLSARARVSH